MAVAVRARVAAGVVEVAGWVMVAMAMVVAWEARAVRRGWVARMVVDPVEAARRAVMGWRVVVGWEEAEAAVGWGGGRGGGGCGGGGGGGAGWGG